MPELVPAADLARRASRPYPNDSPSYREARTRLLAEEIELRRHIERVSALRRQLPLGGEAKDYRFQDEQGRPVSLPDLFGAHDTLVTYTWMSGPQRERPCPMCTSMLGSLDQPSRDITQKVAFAVIGRSPVERQLAFARERGWQHLRFFQCEDDFARDDRALTDNGEEMPALDVWVKRGGKVHHFWGGEMDGSTMDPGQDPRGAPDIAPLWTILDLTPAGRDPKWYPKLEYPPERGA